MKLYVKTKSKFYRISFLLLILSLLFIFIFKNYELGYLLLGILASTLIIAKQADMAAEVEEGKLLVSNLKEMCDLSSSLKSFTSAPVDFYAYELEGTFYKYKEKLEKLFSINMEICSITDLNADTKEQINKIAERISRLQIDLHIIIKNFKSATKKVKILYYIEFYNIIKEFDFKDLRNMFFEFGLNLDSKEFYDNNYSRDQEIKLLEYDLSVSVPMYDSKLEQKYGSEYKALRKIMD